MKRLPRVILHLIKHLSQPHVISCQNVYIVPLERETDRQRERERERERIRKQEKYI